jgi:hypothetical protein
MAGSKRKESPELQACHRAFAKYIEHSFKLIDCFTEYTLYRDEDGYYPNMSVDMEWKVWRPAWLAGRKYAGQK